MLHITSGESSQRWLQLSQLCLFPKYSFWNNGRICENPVSLDWEEPSGAAQDLLLFLSLVEKDSLPCFLLVRFLPWYRA
jgi:hypothetical protein